MKRFHTSVILLLFALLLVACKSDSDGDTDRSTPQPTAVAWRRVAEPITLDNASNIRLIGRFDAHSTTVVTLEFSDNGAYLASSNLGENSKVRVWNLASGRDVFSFDGSPTTFLLFGPNDETLLTISRDEPVSLIREWSIFDQELLNSLPAQGSGAIVTTIDQSDDRSLLAVGGRRGRVYLFSLNPLTSLEFIDAHPVVSVSDVEFTPDGERLVTLGDGGDVKVWDVASRELLHNFGTFDPEPAGISISPDGSLLALSFSTGVRIIGMDDYESKRILPIETNAAGGYIEFSPDGKWVIGYGAGELVSFWDVETGDLVLGLPGHSSDIAGVIYSEDMQLVATGTRGANLFLWDLSVLQTIDEGATERPQIPRLSIAPNNTMVRLLAWSSDGEHLAFSDLEGSIYIMGVP